MFRRLLIAAALVGLPLMVTSAAHAQFKDGDWELTLSGSAANGPDFDGVTANVNANLGYFITKELEVGVRQTVGFTDIGTSGDLNGSTRIAVDWNFDIGKVVPFLGANIGYVYGDAVNDTWEAAPEAGIKWFVNGTTFIFASVEYQFFFDHNTDSFGNAFSDGQFVYGLGIGFRF
jgi:hypothetical protein